MYYHTTGHHIVLRAVRIHKLSQKTFTLPPSLGSPGPSSEQYATSLSGRAEGRETPLSKPITAQKELCVLPTSQPQRPLSVDFLSRAVYWLFWWSGHAASPAPDRNGGTVGAALLTVCGSDNTV